MTYPVAIYLLSVGSKVSVGGQLPFTSEVVTREANLLDLDLRWYFLHVETGDLAVAGRSKNHRRIRRWVMGASLAALLIASGVTIALTITRQKDVLIIGDSLTYESAPALTSDLLDNGFSVQVSAIPGSGLLDTHIDWLAHAKQLISSDNPDIVVVEFIGDYGLFGTPPGLGDRTPEFYAHWQSVAQQLEMVLTSRGAQVYWVVGPPVEDPANESKLITLDNLYEHLKAPNTHSGVPLVIDATKPFATSSGGYSQYMPGPNGAPVELRVPDGTHFTLAGIALFGKTVAEQVAAGPVRLLM
jgi:hypothetical protein